MTSKNSRQTVKKWSANNDDIEKLLAQALAGEGDLATVIASSGEGTPKTGGIVKGRVVRIDRDSVAIDIGAKADGLVDLSEFPEGAPKVGDEVEVHVDDVATDASSVEISKRRADRIRGWERIIATHKEGDLVKGMCTRKIKGGLLVDIGIPVFLPASQIEIRRASDVSQYIGKEVEARIIKIDEARMNIVISRRKMLEESRETRKKDLLDTLSEGQIRRGTVKNIADFGAFIDLGGIDGLLHITDMSWGRINHPSEMLAIDDQIDVKVLKFDREAERIALGLKQKTSSPWENIEARYTTGMKLQGEIVNVMSYGAFVKLEEGVEGLVHISEMSAHHVEAPEQVVTPAEELWVKIIDLDLARRRISLSIKQAAEGGELAEEYRGQFQVDEQGNWVGGGDDSAREAAWSEYFDNAGSTESTTPAE